jgi:hypothetical protein
MKHHTDTSEILLQGMRDALDVWGTRLNGTPEPLYWVLRLQLSDTGLSDGVTVQDIAAQIPAALRNDVEGRFQRTRGYWRDIRYASLEPVTQLWGTIVNGMRVVAESGRATEMQKKVFDYADESLVAFFRACRERMEVADALYHSYKAMPAPECQALAALLNVHIDAPLDADTLCRTVRLLDHEGPMSPEEHQDLAAISNTSLLSAAFRGLRYEA